MSQTAVLSKHTSLVDGDRPVQTFHAYFNAIVLEIRTAVKLPDDQWATAARKARRRLTKFHKHLCRTAIPEMPLDTVELLLVAFAHLSSTPDFVRGVVYRVLENHFSEGGRNTLSISENIHEFMHTATPVPTFPRNIDRCELGIGVQDEAKVDRDRDNCEEITVGDTVVGTPDKRETQPFVDNADLIGNTWQDGRSKPLILPAMQDLKDIGSATSPQLASDLDHLTKAASAATSQRSPPWRCILIPEENICVRYCDGKPLEIVESAQQTCSQSELGWGMEKERSNADQDFPMLPGNVPMSSRRDEIGPSWGDFSFRETRNNTYAHGPMFASRLDGLRMRFQAMEHEIDEAADIVKVLVRTVAGAESIDYGEKIEPNAMTHLTSMHGIELC
ncbi:hypothetical protein CVT26_004438 [Gymnopilus dilepis]|uniref:Uncharacterized protein n=1 Tax=Gymnopilus dilepis TaxID=231916 RepID=A0A409W6V8_9AGAR|nr:hypothetical protein CVT26_004438 [Gymnopilus dilepis]